VATAIVRARRAGEAIVREARRRGVEAIVLAAEESSKVRGGSLLGGRGGPLENYVGDVSRYVISKAPCRVILTAPPADWQPSERTVPQPPPADEEPVLTPAVSVDELDPEAEETLAELQNRPDRRSR
jgi:APA family basic amino acid/polyamine antiporter